MATKTYLFDTSILISHLRASNETASQWVGRAARGEIRASISVMTYIEVWVGAKSERHRKEAQLLFRIFKILEINRRIAHRAAELWRPVNQESRHKQLPDVLIAATAEYYRTGIVTTNSKDFEAFSLNEVKVIDCN